MYILIKKNRWGHFPPSPSLPPSLFKIADLNECHTSVFVDPLPLPSLLCSLNNKEGDTKGLKERKG